MSGRLTYLSNVDVSRKIVAQCLITWQKQGVLPTINIKFSVFCEFVGYHIWFTNRPVKNSAPRYRSLRLCLQTDRWQALIILIYVLSKQPSLNKYRPLYITFSTNL